MVYNFDKNSYINVDEIDIMRWIEQENGQSGGIVVVRGCKIVVDKKAYDKILKAFKRYRKDCMYDQNLKRDLKRV